MLYKEQELEKKLHAFPFLIMALKDWAASWKNTETVDSTKVTK